MKKIINIVLVLSIILSYYIPINLVVYADECKYKVSAIEKNNNETAIGCYSNYSEAKTKMLEYESTENKIAVIYENSTNRLINARYAIAKLVPGRVLSVFPSKDSSSKYTSVNTSYGIDAAFIDYDPSSNRAQIRISGYTGWVDVGKTGKTVKVLVDYIYIREDHSTSSKDIGGVYLNNSYEYYDTYNDGTYIWYKIKASNGYGWFASQIGKNWTKEEQNNANVTITPINQLNTFQTYYEPYTGSSNLIHYFEHAINGYVTQSYTNVGPKPSFLTNGKKYYSFDGNYFYTTLTAMLDDYRNNVSTNSINKTNPHYPYYLFLPNHTKTGYTASDFNEIIKNRGYTAFPDPSIKYVIYNSSGKYYEFDSKISRAKLSLMYGQGQNFVDAANTYGINALMMFGTALNESATGTSLIAFLKNNLFGLGAYDSNPVEGARSYATVRDSIMDYAKFVGSNDSNYSNPNNVYYFGSHYGNKGSGMNVNYATDPYWGEKQSANSYYNDLDFGMQDYKANTIGVTNKIDVKIYKKADTSSSVIYTLKNRSQSVYNIPVIVFDKVSVTKGDKTTEWYKVYTDVALDSNQNIANVDYEFSKSYGYIKAEDLYVENEQPTIIANNIAIYQNETVNLLSGVSANDKEDGNLTSKIVVSGEYDVSLPGEYNITYTVEDSSFFTVTKTIILTVNPSNQPYIGAYDKEISQYTAFDPKKDVTANDYRDGDITSNIIVVENNVNPNIKGEYKVKYSVTNSLGNVTIKEITITVIDNEKPIIIASNKVIKINDPFNPLSGVSASDKEDGNLTSNVTVVESNVDVTKVGTYKIKYSVIDTAGNITIKEITVTVEERDYVNKKGEFYFEKLEWNNEKQKLEVAGYLAITGMNNTSKENILYDLILKDNNTDEEIIFPLERWLEGHPNRSYSDGKYNYSDTWFKGELDLSITPNSEYTVYIRARNGNYQAINLFRNIFNKEMTRKIQTTNGTGYLFRNNNYKTDFPLELFVRKEGLISTIEPSHSSNMFTSYKTINFDNNFLNIIGSSYNINGDYNKDQNVERYIILENKKTFERYTYNVGSVVGSEIPLKVSDNKSKVRAWFDSSGKIDITTLPVGEYIIYIRTKTGNIDDFGELNDIFIKDTSKIKQAINGREYSISLNKKDRFRIELIIKNQA